METSARHTSAGELLADTHARLADVERAIRSHRFLDAVAERAVPEERLRALAGEQWTIVASDRRAFALLASRFPAHAAGDFFLSLAEGGRGGTVAAALVRVLARARRGRARRL